MNTLSVSTYLAGLKAIVEYKIISTSFIQRRLDIGYASANNVIIGAEEMGIISRATKAKPSEVLISIQEFNDNIAFYIMGAEARLHDFDTVEGIRSISIPDYKSFSGVASPVNNIEYILQRRATRHKKNGNLDLAIECLKKSNEIMPYSNFEWNKADYLRLADFLMEAGRNEEAKWINICFGGMNSRNEDIRETSLVKSAETLGYDLVQMTEHYPTCEKCAIFQNRVFSISGNDKRFPPLSMVYEEGTHCVHKGCKHSFIMWIEQFNTPEEVAKMIEFSNRPFVDPRSKEEIQLFKQQRYYFFVQDTDRLNYKKLKELLPDIAPKSMGGFSRMKNGNTENYKKLVVAANEIGLDIDKYRHDGDVLELDEIIRKVKELGLNLDFYL